MLEDERRAEVKARLNKAHTHIADLCEGKAKWTMRIPADPERDSDLILSEALSDAEVLLAIVDDQAAELERARVAMRLAEEHGKTMLTNLTTSRADNARLRAELATKTEVAVSNKRAYRGALEEVVRLEAELAKALEESAYAAMQRDWLRAAATDEVRAVYAELIGVDGAGPDWAATQRALTPTGAGELAREFPPPAASSVDGVVVDRIEFVPATTANILAAIAENEIAWDRAHYPNANCSKPERHAPHVWGDPEHWCDGEDVKAFGSIVDDEPELASCNVCNATIQLTSGKWEHQAEPAFVHDAEPHQGEVPS